MIFPNCVRCNKILRQSEITTVKDKEVVKCSRCNWIDFDWQVKNMIIQEEEQLKVLQ